MGHAEGKRTAAIRVVETQYGATLTINGHLVCHAAPDPSRTVVLDAKVDATRLAGCLAPERNGQENPPLALESFAAWLANGDVGLSSLAVVQRLTGVRMTANGTRREGCLETPLDPGDVRRMLGLFDAVPQVRAYWSLMADVSAEWARIVGHWDELEETYRIEEHNPSGCAPKTHRMLKQLKEGKNVQ